ncbi:MAG: hypothetical protein R3C49_03715 [Planctomycetaceae bacterium]
MPKRQTNVSRKMQLGMGEKSRKRGAKTKNSTSLKITKLHFLPQAQLLLTSHNGGRTDFRQKLSKDVIEAHRDLRRERSLIHLEKPKSFKEQFCIGFGNFPFFVKPAEYAFTLVNHERLIRIELPLPFCCDFLQHVLSDFPRFLLTIF